MGRIEGKVAIVTGGGSGIGLATAKMMAKEGAKVLIADINEKGALQAAKEIQGQGGIALGSFFDAASEGSIKDIVDKTIKEFDALDILVNNVGGTSRTKDLDVINLNLEDWEQALKINLTSVMLGCKYAIPHMINGGGGSIINTASTAAFYGDVVQCAYGSSKAGVVNLTKRVAAQYGSKNIRCNAVAPGLISTPAAHTNLPEVFLNNYTKYNCLPYTGEPEDIAYTILFLASDESKYITAQTLLVDGGFHIKNPSSC